MPPLDTLYTPDTPFTPDTQSDGYLSPKQSMEWLEIQGYQVQKDDKGYKLEKVLKIPPGGVIIPFLIDIFP